MRNEIGYLTDWWQRTIGTFSVFLSMRKKKVIDLMASNHSWSYDVAPFPCMAWHAHYITLEKLRNIFFLKKEVDHNETRAKDGSKSWSCISLCCFIGCRSAQTWKRGSWRGFPFFLLLLLLLLNFGIWMIMERVVRWNAGESILVM